MDIGQQMLAAVINRNGKEELKEKKSVPDFGTGGLETFKPEVGCRFTVARSSEIALVCAGVGRREGRVLQHRHFADRSMAEKARRQIRGLRPQRCMVEDAKEKGGKREKGGC